MPAAGTRKEKGWAAVPEFGGWNQKAGEQNYSMVFSKARANRKQQNTGDVVKKASVAFEEETGNKNHHGSHNQYQHEDCSKRKKLLRYLCMIPKKQQ